MIKLGMLDFDTSHVVAFSQRLNKKGIAEEQWVDGAEIVLGCPGTSRMSPERIAGHAKKCSEELGVKLVDKPEDMRGKVDGMLIESIDGGMHLERVKLFIDAGMPLFIDKPLASSLADAEAIAELAEKKNVPIFSASSLRYGVEVIEALAAREELGAPVAVHVYGVQGRDPKYNPGWFNYGIHAAEMLITLLGPGHQAVQYARGETGEQSMGGWKSGAVGSITLTSKGDYPFGFTYLGEKKTRAARVDTNHIYRGLLREVVKFFQSGKAPVPIAETLGIIRYLEDVNKAGGL